MNDTLNTRVVAFGLVGSTEHNGKEILSLLLDYDLFQDGYRDGLSHVKIHQLHGSQIAAYEDVNRGVLYIHLPFERDGEEWSLEKESLDDKNQWMIHMCSVFATCHIVLMLSSETKVDIELIRKFRSMQTFKDAWMPDLQERFPIVKQNGLVPEMQKMRSVMVPGYCEPQLLFLFQTEASDGQEALNKASHAIVEQLASLFQKCEIPPRNATYPVVNKSSVKSLLLPMFPVTVEEHLKQWTAFLEGDQGHNPIQETMISKFRDLVYTRKERMQHMLRSSSDAVFPEVSTVQSAFQFIHSLMTEALASAKTSTRGKKSSGERSSSEPRTSAESSKKRLKKAWRSFTDGATALGKLTTKQCEKAKHSALAHYQQLVSDLYTEHIHEAAVREALKLFANEGHGAGMEDYKAELSAKCLEYWNQGHRQCEVASLTGRPCLKPIITDTAGNRMRCMHDSSFACLSANSSGTLVIERADPFSFFDANCAFYFEPSTDGLASQVQNHVHSSTGSSRSRNRQRTSSSAKAALSHSQASSSQAVSSLDVEIRISGYLEDVDSVSEVCLHLTAGDVCCLQGKRCHWQCMVGLLCAILDQVIGFYSSKDRLYALGLHLPVYTPHVTNTADFDESFPPLSGSVPSMKKLEPFWDTLEEQLESARSIKRELKKHWPEQIHAMKHWPMTSVSLDSSASRSSTSHSRRPSHRYSEHTEDVLVGLEYESMEGMRFIASPKQLPRIQTTDHFQILMTQDIPLFLPSPEKKSKSDPSSGVRPEKLCQLQRIFFVTPSAPTTFATQPCIHFRCHSTEQRDTTAAQFHVEAPVVLPPSSFVVLRLPFVYGIPSEWTGTTGIKGQIDVTATEPQCWTPFLQTTPEHPYDAYIQKHTLLFPV